MSKLVQTFLVLMLFWIGLTGLNAQEIVSGAFFSLVIAVLTQDFIFQEGIIRKLHPARLAHFLAYLPIYVWGEFISHLKVSGIILSPRQLRPAIVKYHPRAKGEVSLAAIGNLTTFTPGTFTLALNRDEMLIHCLDAKGFDVQGDTKKMEKYVRGIAE